MKEFTYKLEEIDKAAAFILEYSRSNLFLMYGDMGSGKTTVIKAICAMLGAKDTAVSPSFSIVNEYRVSSNRSIYHFDLYRLTHLREVLDIGFEEYISDPLAYVFVEWPQLVEPLPLESYTKVSILVEHDNSRRVLVQQINRIQVNKHILNLK